LRYDNCCLGLLNEYNDDDEDWKVGFKKVGFYVLPFKTPKSKYQFVVFYSVQFNTDRC